MAASATMNCENCRLATMMMDEYYATLAEKWFGVDANDVLATNAMPNLPWAKSCSPLVYDDLVVVSPDVRAKRNASGTLTCPIRTILLTNDRPLTR